MGGLEALEEAEAVRDGDVAIDAAVLEYCEAAGGGLSAAICYNVWYGFHQYVLTNTGEDMTVTLSGAELRRYAPVRGTL